MALNRFVGLGILALSAMAVSFTACDDSSSSDPATTPITPVAGVGGSTGTPVTPGAGGVTGVTQPAGTGGTPAATTPAGTTPVAPTGDCSATTDFVAIAAATTDKNWVDPTANGCDISGAFYAYSDKSGSLVTPAPLEGEVAGGKYASPCGAEGCCIEGNTVTWVEVAEDGTTPKYTEWGAGLGFSLSDPGEGGAKAAYTGAVKGFKFTITGAVEGQAVYVKVKHTASDDEMPPLSIKQTVPGTGPWSVEFLTDAKCANYSYKETKCTDTTDGVYDVQVQVNGGTVGGAFKVCLTSLTPIL